MTGGNDTRRLPSYEGSTLDQRAAMIDWARENGLDPSRVLADGLEVDLVARTIRYQEYAPEGTPGAWQPGRNSAPRWLRTAPLLTDPPPLLPGQPTPPAARTLAAALAEAYTPQERRALADYLTIGMDTRDPRTPLLRRLVDALEGTIPPAPPRCPAEVPEPQRASIAEQADIPADHVDWRCYLAPHSAFPDGHIVRPREDGDMLPFTTRQEG